MVFRRRIRPLKRIDELHSPSSAKAEACGENYHCAAGFL
jgi:hypothetical protein